MSEDIELPDVETHHYEITCRPRDKAQSMADLLALLTIDMMGRKSCTAVIKMTRTNEGLTKITMDTVASDVHSQITSPDLAEKRVGPS